MLHAGWNALIKAGGDKALDTALVHLMASLVALVALGLVGPPPAAALPWLAASVLIHLGYYITLAGAYRHGDLGLTYPIMRGSAPLLVALGSASVLGEVPGAWAWAGIAAVTAGVLMVGLAGLAGQAGHRDRAGRRDQGRAIAFALVNAAIVASYTLVDGSGVRETVARGYPVASYVVLLFALEGLPYAALVWWQRSPAGRQAAVAYARRRWLLALAGGLASIGAYGIALWAMTRASVASVAALRETSVLFAAVFGTVFLGERFGLRRALGTLVIVVGVMALRLG